MSTPATRSTVLLVRHAHTDMAGRFCGRSDPDLSQIGQQQLQEIAQRVGKWPFTRVYASPLIRARRTAEAIAASKCLEVSVRPGLGEIDFGAWEGKAWAEIEALYPADAAGWLNVHPAGAATDGESFAAFQRRVLSELHYLAKHLCCGCHSRGFYPHRARLSHRNWRSGCLEPPTGIWVDRRA